MKTHLDAATRDRLVREHLEAIRELESRPVEDSPTPGWPPDRYYLLWHVLVGLTLGGIGALVSFAANALGAPLFGVHPLQLIRVYLTFPMGARALEADQGLILTVGATLYHVTGGLFGIAFHLMMTLFLDQASWAKRFVVATAFGIGLWIFNFYLVLSWLQPLLLGGNWIVRSIPPWVGALTHVTFAWTMLAGEVWGRFEAYRGERSIRA
jgi:hypothetical protein